MFSTRGRSPLRGGGVVCVALFLLASVLPLRGALAATHYFDGDGYDGTVAGSGSEADPFTSLRALTNGMVALEDGDVCRLSGRFFADQLPRPLGMNWSPGVANITFAQWEGRSQAWVFGAHRQTGWTSVGGDVYEVSYNRDASTIAFVGFNMTSPEAKVAGIGASAAGAIEYRVLLGAGTFGALERGEYAVSGGTLRVRLPEGSPSPAAESRLIGVVEQHDGPSPGDWGTAISVSGVGGWVVEGINFALAFGPNAANGFANGYLWYFGGTSGCTLRDCEFWYGGKHNAGFAGSNAYDALIEDCVFGGSLSAFNTFAVFFSQSDGAVRARMIDSELYLFGIVDIDGNRGKSRRVDGFFAHGAVESVELLRCSAYGVEGFVGPPWHGDGGPPPPADRYAADEYAFQFIDCAGYALAGDVTSGTTQHGEAHIRCEYHFARAQDNTDYSFDSTAFTRRSAAAILYESCLIYADVSGMERWDALMRVKTDMTLRNCTFVADFGGVTDRRGFTSFQAGSGRLRGYQNHWYALEANAFNSHFHTASGGQSDEEIIEAYSDLKQNWWYGLIEYSDQNGLDGEGDWEASVHPADENIYGVQPGLVNPVTDPSAMDARGASGGALRETTAFVGPRRPMLRGLDGVAYTGHWGAYQYAPVGCGADLDASGEVNGFDLAVLLGDWGGSNGDADLNGDSIVDAFDLALLLGEWGACP